MDVIIPPLKTNMMFESNPLKSRILVRRLAVVFYAFAFNVMAGTLLVRKPSLCLLIAEACLT